MNSNFSKIIRLASILALSLAVFILRSNALADSYRATLVYFDEKEKLNAIEDGFLEVKNGLFTKVEAFDPKGHKSLGYQDLRGKIITAGFIDTHVHYPQTEMIASYGEQLLEWLKTYTFPTEKEFKNPAHSLRVSKFFLDQLLRNGTTSALVFSTVHKESVEALFSESERRGMRLITGKVLMDRNAPDYLLDTPESAKSESEALIKKWHRKPGTRLEYAVTPRFAPTSTEKQLEVASQLLSEYKTVRLHTHLSENKGELAWVHELFPDRKNYFDVYQHFGLAGNRSVFAHSIHLSEDEWQNISATDSRLSFCPSSNLFLGSGLFDLKKSKDLKVKVGLGSDIGAGTSFSLLQNLNEAYKIQQLQNQKLNAEEALYLATLGGANALGIDQFVGNLRVGNEADFVVLDPASTPLIETRTSKAKSIQDKLFAMIILGDDRSIESTYIFGKKAYQK